MKQYFECTVSFNFVDENGKLKKVTQPLLIEALSYTDAETVVYQIMAERANDFKVKNIKASNIIKVVNGDDSGVFYKVKVAFVAMNEETGSTKKVTEYELVQAATIDIALKASNESNSESVVNIEIMSIALSPIVEVVDYNEAVEPGAEINQVETIETENVHEAFSSANPDKATIDIPLSEFNEINNQVNQTP